MQRRPVYRDERKAAVVNSNSANTAGRRAAIGRWLCVGVVVMLGACPSDRPSTPPGGESGTGAAPGTSSGTTGTGTGDSTVADSTSAAATGSSGTAATAESSESGATRCTKNVVLMGYWPPTNEMLRPWSTNEQQNPEGWIGADWEGYGYDVYAYFPEFPPDGDPTNDAIGDEGAVGSPKFDLRVDYQATSADFWRIVDERAPIILITTSRGGKIGWEVEALEGGHGGDNPGDPSLDWISDGYGEQTQPTEATVQPRSWAAISTYRQGNTLPSRLPMDAIVKAASGLELTTVAIDRAGTSGNFLSGFLGLHGLVYEQQAEHAVAAGHIHVGFGLPNEDARALIEASLRAVLQTHPAGSTSCSPVDD